jgi:plasmid stability protein
MITMRQMITRLDDDLHEALKRKAKTEGKSLNTLVIETLSRTVAPEDAQAAFVEELRAKGWLSEHAQPEGPIPTLLEIRQMDGGAGSAVLVALLAERDENR